MGVLQYCSATPGFITAPRTPGTAPRGTAPREPGYGLTLLITDCLKSNARHYRISLAGRGLAGRVSPLRALARLGLSLRPWLSPSLGLGLSLSLFN